MYIIIIRDTPPQAGEEIYAVIVWPQDAGLDLALDDVMSRAEAMAEHIANTTASSKELQEGFDQQALYVEVLKTSYQAFKEAWVQTFFDWRFRLKGHERFVSLERQREKKEKVFKPCQSRRSYQAGRKFKVI